jgi:hypothetical protein
MHLRGNTYSHDEKMKKELDISNSINVQADITIDELF